MMFTEVREDEEIILNLTEEINEAIYSFIKQRKDSTAIHVLKAMEIIFLRSLMDADLSNEEFEKRVMLLACNADYLYKKGIKNETGI